MSEQLSYAELFRQAIESRLVDLHVALPARVEKVDMATQTVDVKPVLMRSIPRGEDDPPLVEQLPIIQSVPLVFPRGGGFFMTAPVVKGDYVLCVFSERDIGQWRVVESDDVNPGDQRLHPLSGAMAIPGVFKAKNKLQSASSTALVFGKDGEFVVTVTDSRMEVGGNSEEVALASRVENLETFVLGHVHPYVDSGAPATTSAPTPPASPIPPYGSQVLKVGS